MLKKQIRLEYLKKRSLLDLKLIGSFSLEISNMVLRLPIWDFSFYHTFLTIDKNKEVDTSYLLTVLQGKDKNIVVPKVSAFNQLENYLLLDSTPLKLNHWNIPEPVDGIKTNENKIDVVFIPLLAYDKKGNRVGYGKGYYDKFLSKCRPDVLKIGLSFFEPEEVIEDIDLNDVPLNYCVTPHKIYEF